MINQSRVSLNTLMNKGLIGYLFIDCPSIYWDRRGRDRMVVGFTNYAKVPIITDVVSSNLDQGEVYNIM